MGNRSSLPEPLAVTLKVTGILETLGIDYMIGGSLASTLYGEVRTTMDSDILAGMREEHMASFVEALQGEFFMDVEMIADAVRRNASFNIIHRESMFKVDVFIPAASPFNRSQLARARRQTFSDDPPAAASFATAEKPSYPNWSGTAAAARHPNDSGAISPASSKSRQINLTSATCAIGRKTSMWMTSSTAPCTESEHTTRGNKHG
ncbi:MAG: hypothetical protein V1755_00930 [Chloroflexota bacterium]